MRNNKFIKSPSHKQIVLLTLFLITSRINVLASTENGDDVKNTVEKEFMQSTKNIKKIQYDDSALASNETKAKSWGNFFARPTQVTLLGTTKPPKNNFMSADAETLGSFERHPCRRVCDGKSLTCYYRLALHNYQRFGQQCKQCQYDPAACEAEKCIYGDGVRSGIQAVNYMSPGPSIEMCENDLVVIDVLNYLSEPTTLHWHGLHMTQTPDMDGAPYVTQYPIQPGEMCRYNFRADRSGTNWYHGHVGWQRALGVAGAFVIRQTNAANHQAYLYDYDLIEHTLVIQDIIYNYNFEKPSNILINGKGRNHLSALPDNDAKHRYERLYVTPGNRYRMRVISNGIFNCPIEFSIENHRLLIISTDGNDIEPILADSFFMASAERFDFVLDAKQYVNNYWIRVRGYNNCSQDNLYQGAVLHYRGVKRDLLPELPLQDMQISRSQLSPVDGFSENVVVNYLWELKNDTNRQPDQQLFTTNVATSALKALSPLPWPTYTKFLTYYTSFGLKFAPDGTLRFQIDDITFATPGVSLLQARHLISEDNYYCNRSALLAAGRNCQYANCQCVNVIRLPAYRPIELVVTNLLETTHPFHTHGFTYRLVGQGVIGSTHDLRRVFTMT